MKSSRETTNPLTPGPSPPEYRGRGEPDRNGSRKNHPTHLHGRSGESLSEDLLHLRLEAVHVVLGDDAMRDEDAIARLHARPVLEHIIVPLGETGEDLDR